MKVVITGSSTGIGRALTERLLSRGHQVWGLARSDQKALELRFPGAFHGYVCDVAEWSQVAEGAAEIARASSHVDALVTAAGLQGEVGETVRADPAKWSATLRVNLDGTFHAIRAFYELLSRSPSRAKVVCFSGGGSTKARPFFSAYGVAKTGVVRLVETIAEEVKGGNVDINSVAPGAVLTHMTDQVIALGPTVAGEAEYNAAVKLKSAGSSAMEKALAGIEWMLSPASDGISGKLISAPWDPWATLPQFRDDLEKTDIYTLRRIVPEDRGKRFSS